jgi:hypothetical protein
MSVANGLGEMPRTLPDVASIVSPPLWKPSDGPFTSKLKPCPATSVPSKPG